MARILILLIVIVALFVLGKWFQQQYRERGRSFAVKALLVSIAVVFVILAATGRAHWVGALLASVIAALRFALPLLLRHLPFLHSLLSSRANAESFGNSQQSGGAGGGSGSEMSIAEALETLGLEPNPLREDIIDAHRRLIQKLHPDRGGNDYLAAKINKAKDILIKHCKN